MEARELRIGNYVYHGGFTKSTLEINMIDLCGVVSFQGAGLHELEKCEPIPLTEEWLIKLGFTNPDNSMLSHIYIKGMISINIGNHFTIMVYGKPIRQIDNHYVHTLQNLYFAIEQEELIYTP